MRKNDYDGVIYKTSNTLGGPFAENRGRRGFDTRESPWNSSPFEDQRSDNWIRREGWDQYYNHPAGNRHRTQEGHSGRGPRGYKRSDDSIYHDVCDTLTMSPDVNASEIEVTVKDGVVYLNGHVEDRQMKKNAELDIENVSGVIDVQNLLDFGESNEELH